MHLFKWVDYVLLKLLIVLLISNETYICEGDISEEFCQHTRSKVQNYICPVLDRDNNISINSSAIIIIIYTPLSHRIGKVKKVKTPLFIRYSCGKMLSLYLHIRRIWDLQKYYKFMIQVLQWFSDFQDALSIEFSVKYMIL